MWLKVFSLTTHQKYIKRCIQIAKTGLGITYPNPNVGCVIVCNNRIIGEGVTSAYGGNHAEVNAIKSVRDQSLLQKSTLYVTLEPCSHYGKTPPCSDRIISHQIPQVVIGATDSNPLVAGNGIKKLKKAGCEVLTGILESECNELHRRFLTFHLKKRPYIILKWAESKDGFIAPPPEYRKEKTPVWITGPLSRQLVHQWRSQEHAILVGSKTVMEDNPRLTTRDWYGRNPVRVILDRTMKIPDNFHVYDKEAPSIFLTQNESKSNENIQIEIMHSYPYSVGEICNVLYQNQIQSVIVEGGAETISCFINSGLWDEARVFKGNAFLGKGIKAPELSGSVKQSFHIQNDVLNLIVNS